jgi:hypothetical protein
MVESGSDVLAYATTVTEWAAESFSDSVFAYAARGSISGGNMLVASTSFIEGRVA